MKVIATELKIGDLVKQRGFTFEILSEPQKAHFESYKSDKQVKYDVKYVDFNSRNYPYKQLMEVKEKIKNGELKDTYVMFNKKTMIKTY